MINSPLDFYDDPTGSVLKERLTSIDKIPDFIKTAERLTAVELDRLPDDVFALVALDRGEKMRKFACVDKGNTALSVMYFMENKGLLPDEAQKTAAANLVTACGWYGITPPVELEKVASDPAQLKWEQDYLIKQKKTLGSMPSDPKTRAKWISKARSWEKKNPGSDAYIMPGTVDTPKPGKTLPWEKKSSVEKTAAVNLMTACGWYDMSPPDELEKVAFLGFGGKKKSNEQQVFMAGAQREVLGFNRDAAEKGAGVRASFNNKTGIVTMSEGGKVVAKHIVRPGGKGPNDPAVKFEKIALVGAAMGALTMGTGLMQGNKDYKRRKAAMKAGMPASQAFKLKESELSGSNAMPYSKEVGPMKMASLNPYIDITGMGLAMIVEEETGTRHALIKEGEAKYPIDTAEQVQRACTYFEKCAENFTPVERHIFCQNVSRRASDLGLHIPDRMAKYGSSTLAKDAGVQVYRRQRLFREGTSEHGLLQEMREKYASIRPEVLAVTLEQFDRRTNLDRMWDNGLDDPYYSVFGVEKTAEYSFVDGNDHVTETRLKECAKRCKEDVKGLFDEDMADEFSKNPVQIFESMPLDSKRILMRLSQQVEE